MPAASPTTQNDRGTCAVFFQKESCKHHQPVARKKLFCDGFFYFSMFFDDKKQCMVGQKGQNVGKVGFGDTRGAAGMGWAQKKMKKEGANFRHFFSAV